jgi:hypothetical protein
VQCGERMWRLFVVFLVSLVVVSMVGAAPLVRRASMQNESKVVVKEIVFEESGERKLFFQGMLVVLAIACFGLAIIVLRLKRRVVQEA